MSRICEGDEESSCRQESQDDEQSRLDDEGDLLEEFNDVSSESSLEDEQLMLYAQGSKDALKLVKKTTAG